MEVQKTERDLVVELRDADLMLEEAEAALEKAKSRYDKAEAAIIELLTARNATATAKYEGVGVASLVKPKLYASCRKENESKLFAYLETQGRRDLVKQSVNSAALSGLVKEKVEQGETVPEFITYYLQPSVKLAV